MHVCVCLSLYFRSEKKNTLLDLVRNGTDNFFLFPIVINNID